MSLSWFMRYNSLQFETLISMVLYRQFIYKVWKFMKKKNELELNEKKREEKFNDFYNSFE